MQIEPRNKILMKTIRMKDLEALKLALPKPSYHNASKPISPNKSMGHNADVMVDQDHLPNLSPNAAAGGGNFSSRSRKFAEVQASINGASYSLDHVRAP